MNYQLHNNNDDNNNNNIKSNIKLKQKHIFIVFNNEFKGVQLNETYLYEGIYL